MVNGEHLQMNAVAYVPMGNALANAWHPQPATPDGLETIRSALIAMECGRCLDEATARHLGRAFRMYLAGEEPDITKGLGLRPGRGRSNESPLRRERLLRRDALIRKALEALGGDTPGNRQNLRSLLTACDLVQPQPWRDVPYITELRNMYGGQLELSEKQIGRIAQGKTAYSQRGA